MLIIPAIDLKDGQVVRLLRGRFEKPTIYLGKPEEFAFRWQEEGAQELHVIDLDGALSGKPKNLDCLERIIKRVKIKVQFGGGLRKREDIKMVMERGVNRIILGTKALDIGLLEKLVAEFGDKLGVSLDAVGEVVQKEAWLKSTNLSLNSFAQTLEKIGIKYAIYTDITRDGTLNGPNIENFKKLLKIVNINLILSGGIAGIRNIKELGKIKTNNFYGIIVGRALYEGKLSLREAIESVENKERENG